MWGVQLLVVNAYVVYKTVHLYMWKKSIMSHYEFRCQIVLACLLSGSDASSQSNICLCKPSSSKAKEVSYIT